MARLRVLTGEFFKGLLLSLVGFLMPIHGKRILLVTTLHMQLVRDGIFQEETLEKLNEALKLAKVEGALKFPASVYDKVWDDQKLQAAIRNAINGEPRGRTFAYDDAKLISASIIEVTPPWLRYGRRDDMMSDLMNLFYRQSSLIAQAQAA